MNADAHYYRDREGRHCFRVDWTDETGSARRARTTPAELVHGACARLEALLAVITPAREREHEWSSTIPGIGCCVRCRLMWAESLHATPCPGKP